MNSSLSPLSSQYAHHAFATLLWAESGLGVAIVDESLNEPRDEGDLCFRPLNGKNMQAQRLLVTHEAHQPSAVAKTFWNTAVFSWDLKRKSILILYSSHK